MRILFVATKVPWPPDDGGKLLVLETLRAFGGRHDVTLLAPGEDRGEVTPLHALCRVVTVPVRRSLPIGRLLRGAPMSVARHAHPEVVRRAEELARSDGFDLVHAEQFQALDAARAAAGAAGLPLVLRAQNVESDLWEGAAAAGHPLVRWAMALEARRFARREGTDLSDADVTVAVTPRDRDRLRALSGLGEERIVHAPVPFPAKLPQSGEPLEGSPAAVLMGSAGWHPNRDGARWFLHRVWPGVERRVPGAILHLFGGAAARTSVRSHRRPEDAALAFVPGSILVVPLRYGSGVRMRVLEAWARGVPVVATREAMAGLEARAGEDHLEASDAPSFAAALARIAAEPSLRETLVRAGRRRLESAHDPARAAAALTAVYERAIERTSSRRARA